MCPARLYERSSPRVIMQKLLWIAEVQLKPIGSFNVIVAMGFARLSPTQLAASTALRCLRCRNLTLRLPFAIRKGWDEGHRECQIRLSV